MYVYETHKYFDKKSALAYLIPVVLLEVGGPFRATPQCSKTAVCT